MVPAAGLGDGSRTDDQRDTELVLMLIASQPAVRGTRSHHEFTATSVGTAESKRECWSWRCPDWRHKGRDARHRESSKAAVDMNHGSRYLPVLRRGATADALSQCSPPLRLCPPRTFPDGRCALEHLGHPRVRSWNTAQVPLLRGDGIDHGAERFFVTTTRRDSNSRDGYRPSSGERTSSSNSKVIVPLSCTT